MKLFVLYRPASEHATMVESYLRDFQRQNPAAQVETIHIDTRRGTALAVTYDIVRYPALLAVRDDESPVFIWQGEALPLMNEVASYLTPV